MDKELNLSIIPNKIDIKQLYHMIILPFITCNMYYYWIKCKTNGISNLIPLSTIGIFVIKMIVYMYILDDRIDSMESITIDILNIYHFYHITTIQKYILLWLNSNRILYFYNFIKTYIGSCVKMLICIEFVRNLIINQVYHHRKLTISHIWLRSDIQRFILYLIFFVTMDIFQYYLILINGIFDQSISNKYVEYMLQKVSKQCYILGNYQNFVKSIILIQLSIVMGWFSLSYIYPHLNHLLIYINHSFRMDIHMNMIIVMLLTLLIFCDINIKYNLIIIITPPFNYGFDISTNCFNIPNLSNNNDTLDNNSNSNNLVAISTECNTTIKDIKCIDIILNKSNSNNNTVLKSSIKEIIEEFECNQEDLDNNEFNLNVHDQKIIDNLENGLIRPYNLEMITDTHENATKLRRIYIQRTFKCNAVMKIPYKNYPYDIVHGQCCENVIGYIAIPLGIAGPCVINNKNFWIPLATTEGCLVASINRGFAAIRKCGGISAFIVDDGMTRSPILQANSVQDCLNLKNWLKISTNFKNIKTIFESTSRYAKLCNIDCTIAGKMVYLRFKATTGNAMGMNMVSKAVEITIEYIINIFPHFQLISLSGNHCTDKKSAAINWICGRGKTVISEATIQPDIIKNLLKVDNIDRLIELCNKKIYVGSALAGSIGGFNAHASNSVAAIFAATGQDLGQIVESSNCLTIIDKNPDNSLYISCTMPSLEVGTIGGGTILPTQKSCLQIMNVNQSGIGTASESLAMLICATVLAGELSLLSSLCEGTLVKSHLKHNRSQTNIINLKSKLSTQNLPLSSPCDVDTNINIKHNKKRRTLSHHNTCPML